MKFVVCYDLLAPISIYRWRFSISFQLMNKEAEENKSWTKLHNDTLFQAPGESKNLRCKSIDRLLLSLFGFDFVLLSVVICGLFNFFFQIPQFQILSSNIFTFVVRLTVLLVCCMVRGRWFFNVVRGISTFGSSSRTWSISDTVISFCFDHLSPQRVGPNI